MLELKRSSPLTVAARRHTLSPWEKKEQTQSNFKGRDLWCFLQCEGQISASLLSELWYGFEENQKPNIVSGLLIA